ncbi:MAG: hypothetical protein EKK46_06310 [Rhodocyclaceae bacterium]|nr:MAG: hypothetical protein EKK46_06310 [Rhodocyclaceae bacterium]
MTDRVISFFEFSEIDKRENFNIENGISIENFLSLIGPYQLSEIVKCQVEHVTGRCKHPHKNGWLGKRKDGAEALIGKNCASQYFNADQNFVAERKRVDMELRIDGHIAALSVLLNNKDELWARLGEADHRMKAIQKIRHSFHSVLSVDARKRLTDMVKTGNWAVIVQVKHLEKDDNGKERAVWRERNIGTMAGVDVFDAGHTSDISSTLAAIKVAIHAANPSRDEKEKDLRGWREAIEKLPAYVEKITLLERSLASFSSRNNISLLSVLGTAPSNKMELGKLLLTLEGNPVPSNNKTNALLGEISDLIKQKADGKEYRTI